jgi:uncharacterized Zn-binding protein involved in type VI secretion
MGANAVRVGDPFVCPQVTATTPHVGGSVSPGAFDSVRIGGMVAAREGDVLTCGGLPTVIARGSPMVLIGGRGAARVGDPTGHGGQLTQGFPQVLIGDGPVPASQTARAQGATTRAPASSPPSGSMPRHNRLNREFATKIDFVSLAAMEGGQRLLAYVPPAGRSGVTVATGVDLGQISLDELKGRRGLAADLTKRLLPYVGKIRGRDAPEELLRHRPLRISSEEADQIDEAWQRPLLKAAISEWDRRGPSVEFRSLSSAQQTVLFSRTYHQGAGMPDTAIAQAFYRAAQKGRWAEAEQLLRDYPTHQGWYRSRVAREADLLRRERAVTGTAP